MLLLVVLVALANAFVHILCGSGAELPTVWERAAHLVYHAWFS